jgi:hypothetical protein
MPGEPSTTQSGTRAIDGALLAIGFTARGDGTLRAPSGARTQLIPVGSFYELRISLGNGAVVTAVLSKAAVKITREGAKP